MESTGVIAYTPRFNSVSNYLSDPALTPVLTSLITRSRLPLTPIEQDVAVDSPEFTSCRFVRRFNKKYGRNMDDRESVKVHILAVVVILIAPYRTSLALTDIVVVGALCGD